MFKKVTVHYDDEAIITESYEILSGTASIHAHLLRAQQELGKLMNKPDKYQSDRILRGKLAKAYWQIENAIEVLDNEID